VHAVFDSGLFTPFRENVFTKLKVHNALHCRQKRTEPRSQVTCTDRHTYIHDTHRHADRNTGVGSDVRACAVCSLMLIGVNVVDCDKCFHVSCWQALAKRSSRASADNCHACTRTVSTNTPPETSQKPTVSAACCHRNCLKKQPWSLLATTRQPSSTYSNPKLYAVYGVVYWATRITDGEWLGRTSPK